MHAEADQRQLTENPLAKTFLPQVVEKKLGICTLIRKALLYYSSVQTDQIKQEKKKAPPGPTEYVNS